MITPCSITLFEAPAITVATNTSPRAKPVGRYYVRTLGCKVNTFDSHALASQFERAGWQKAESPEAADTVVINSCSVTAAAEKEARYLLRKYRRDNPSARLVVTGCYAQTDSAALTAMAEVDFVVPNEAKDSLVTYLESGVSAPEPATKLPADVASVSANRQAHFKSSLTLFDHPTSEQTRAFLKIQDGCNGFCTYCIIPYARGASRQVPAPDVIARASELVARGVREIVLTGIHLGDFAELPTLIASLITIPGLARLRLSSLEPNELTDDLLATLAAFRERICAHFHLPLQSGSDTVLQRMRRTYNSAAYLARVGRARELFPEARFSADVIPGFPGETAEEFAATCAFIRACGLSSLHVFPYSRRPNTAANKMPNHVDVAIIRERARILRDLSDELDQAFIKRQIGTEADVLWENEVDDAGRRLGWSGNYVRVASPADVAVAPGQISRVKLKGFILPGILLGAVPCS